MEKSRHYSWLLAMLSTLLTLGLHAYLALKFYALRFGALGQSSACNINELWNCDAVSASSYAQFLGIPLAIWGLSTHIILALFLIQRVCIEPGTKKTQKIILLFTDNSCSMGNQ